MVEFSNGVLLSYMFVIHYLHKFHIIGVQYTFNVHWFGRVSIILSVNGARQTSLVVIWHWSCAINFVRQI